MKNPEIYTFGFGMYLLGLATKSLAERNWIGFGVELSMSILMLIISYAVYY